MLRALRTAALGMSTQQAGVDNIANNLANVNTTGYKRSTIVFQDLLYQTVQAAGQGEAGGGAQPASLQMGHGAAAIATVRNFTQGSFSETGNSLDMAINGEGFLQVLRPDGSLAYTRDGSFTLSADGAVVTQTGLALDALEQALHARPDIEQLVHHSDRGVQYLSICYTERLAEAGIEPSGGSVGDSYDNALAESVIGLYKTEVIRRRGPWRNLEAVEFATREWVDWFDNRRLLEPIGNIPPVEFEEAYYRSQEAPAVVAGIT